MAVSTPLVAVVGPTASGKTRRAVEIARHYGGEIISGDSRQVYRGMDIGTGKDLEEYGEISYHLIDIADAGQKFNLHQYVTGFHKALEQIRWRGNLPVLCGGTGMYVETVLSGIRLPEVPENPQLRKRLSGLPLNELESILRTYKTLHNTTDVDTVKRAVRAIEIEEYYRDHPEAAQAASRAQAKPLDAVIIGIDIPRDERRRAISQRLRRRIVDGMADEVRGLIDRGVAPEDLIYYGLEYKFVTLYVTGEISREQMEHDLEIAIHQFAKRQMTWFRGMERRGFPIHWLPWDISTDAFLARVDTLLR